MPAADPNRTVHCTKLDKELPAMATPPFPNELGKRIQETISKEAWDLWLKESVRYINTYRWDLANPQHAQELMKQMKIWLGWEEGEMVPTAWTPGQDD